MGRCGTGAPPPQTRAGLRSGGHGAGAAARSGHGPHPVATGVQCACWDRPQPTPCPRRPAPRPPGHAAGPCTGPLPTTPTNAPVPLRATTLKARELPRSLRRRPLGVLLPCHPGLRRQCHCPERLRRSGRRPRSASRCSQAEIHGPGAIHVGGSATPDRGPTPAERAPHGESRAAKKRRPRPPERESARARTEEGAP